MVQFLNLHLVEQVGSFKITGSFKLEGTLADLLSNLLLKVGSAKRSDQVAQGFVQSGIENLKNGDCTTSFANLFPCLISTAFIAKNPFSSDPV